MEKKKQNIFSLKATPSVKRFSESTGRTPKYTGTYEGLLPTPNASDHITRKTSKSWKAKGAVNFVLSNPEVLFSRVVSLVSPSRKLVFGKAQVMIDIYGQRCLELFPKSNQNGSSLKMLSDFLLYRMDWCLSKCAPTWKAKITKSNRMLFQLAPSVRRIGGTGYGLLPTTREQDAERGIEYAPDGYVIRKNGVRHGAKVKDLIGTRTGLKLQPAFVEWMMGFPDKWTELPL